MNACIVCIGNELLSGYTADTNSRWLCEQLLGIGIPVKGVWLVPDDHQRIVQSLKQAEQHGQIILVTGGMGPTDDDITRPAVADFLNVPLEFKQELLDQFHTFFARMGRPMAEKNRVQAWIPKGCEILENPRGTAAGFWRQTQDLRVAVLPGVPAEMMYMFETQVLPRIQTSQADSIVQNAKVRCFGLGESDLAQRLGNLMQRGRNPLINTTCGAGEVILHISAMARDQADAAALIEKDKVLLRELLGDYIYGYEEETLASVVGGLLRQRRKKIAVAESCTGGLLCKMLTDCPGSSDYLLCGWITYSNSSKIVQLGVPEQTLSEYGAVSEQTARAMALGAAQKSGANVVLGVTGIAGPGGATDQKPVGLVYISVFYDGRCSVHEYRFPVANRTGIRQRAALTALNLARMQLRI
ncbi:MAG: competence/damage-inducible protein A [Planctomycetaceae bacterium]|nr:competence/damage-inducible protein A [Planctomycetaceae bacterium]